LLEWRNLVCGVMIVIVPVSLFAQNTTRALLRSDGGALLNSNPAPETSALFPDNLIQTPKGRIATIDAEGSSVTIEPETMLQFEGDELVLDHGTLHLNTARQMRVRVNCVSVIPVTADRTEYVVTDVDGKVKVAALKNDVKIHYAGSALRNSKQGSSDVIVREGEQATRDEHCGAAVEPKTGVDATGAILNSPRVWIPTLAVVGLITCLGLCHGDDPISPSKP
jgi:hypothetical protein